MAGQGAMILRLIRILAVLSALPLLLAGCGPLDREEEVRARIRDWVFLAQTRSFISRSTCTAAIFDTVSGALRTSGPVRAVDNLRSGAREVDAGRIVAFEVPGLTPNAVSEGLMSLNLAGGLGLISSFTGPARACMDEAFQRDVYLALMSPETVLVYDAGGDALLLLHRPSQIAFYLRGNV